MLGTNEWVRLHDLNYLMLCSTADSCRNPFYLRQMLEVCHRKSCLWYSWKESAWEYDLDRVFAEFETESYGQQLNTKFITRRLQDLPPAARSILAWASLIGNSFSFLLVQRLLSGEFDYVDDQRGYSKGGYPDSSELFTPQPMVNVVEGLQAALQAYILTPGSDDDQFRYEKSLFLYPYRGFRLIGQAFHMTDTFKPQPHSEKLLTSKKCTL